MIGERKIFKTLLGIIALDQTYLTITFPLITLIFFDPHTRLFATDTPYAIRSMWYGLCVALPNMINIFFAPLLSSLSDEYGRKKILLIEIFSAFLFTLTVGAGIYLGLLSLIFFGFIIKGAFSRTNPTALAIIGDTAPKDKKILYMGYLQFAISIGATIGPILGGLLATRFFFPTLNFAFPFLLAASIALLNTCLTFYFMPETLQKKVVSSNSSSIVATIKEIFTHPDILRISLILLLIQLSWSTYYQFIPPLLKILYGFNSHELGWFIGIIACWLALATSLGILCLNHFFSLHQMLVIAIYLVLVGLIISVLACAKLLPHSLFFVWLGAMPTAAGDVIAYSCLTTLYSNVVPAEKQGKVMGIAFIVVGSIWALTGFLGGILMGLSPLLPLTLAPIGVICSLFLVQANFGRKLAINYR